MVFHPNGENIRKSRDITIKNRVNGLPSIFHKGPPFLSNCYSIYMDGRKKYDSCIAQSCSMVLC